MLSRNAVTSAEGLRKEALPSLKLTPRPWTRSTTRTLLHEKINPKDWQVLSLGDVGFLQFFRVVSGDYGKPCESYRLREYTFVCEGQQPIFRRFCCSFQGGQIFLVNLHGNFHYRMFDRKYTFKQSILRCVCLLRTSWISTCPPWKNTTSLIPKEKRCKSSTKWAATSYTWSYDHYK